MKRKQMASEFVIFLAILAAILFIFRFWIGVVIALIALISLAVFCFVHSIRMRQHEQEQCISEEAKNEPEVKETKYSMLLKAVTQLVQSEYPTAKWVWGQSDTQNRLNAGDDVFIILSGADGYSRVRVLFDGDRAVGLECPKASHVTAKPNEECREDQRADNLPKNYDLFAYEWVEAHIQALNEQCNDALGRGEHEIVIPSETLPAKESWVSICRELNRNDLHNTECISDGIKIKLA